MLWAASTLCFFGFFRAGELTIPTQWAFNPARHLSLGDITMDDPMNPSMLRVQLKYSKTDHQFGRGVEVFVGKMGCNLCPVAGTLAYYGGEGVPSWTILQI